MNNVKQTHMFTNKMLMSIVIPCILENLLNSLMGTADTIMVSNVGSAAISAAANVDTVSILLIQLFTALAAGGSIISAQYIGQKNLNLAKQAGEQLLFIMFTLSITISLFCLGFNGSILRLIFGQVEETVMSQSQIYFYYMAVSFPFIAIYNTGASVFRAQENTRTPMTISVISNLLNILGNAVLIFGFHLGITGAAAATLFSRIFCAITVMILLRNERHPVYLKHYLRIRPNPNQIRTILFLGIPSGIENSMFQLGKLAVQSTVSTLGTAAIAANAMTNIMENLNGMAGIGVGIAMMTIIGECIGAGRKDEAIYYIKKLTIISEFVIIISCLIVYALARPITILGGMDPESAKLCLSMVGWITIIKPLFWVLSFMPAYGMRAAGDVKFSMLVSCTTIWLFRFSISFFMMRVIKIGPMGVWIGMFSDWAVRGLIFSIRFKSMKWLKQSII